MPQYVVIRLTDEQYRKTVLSPHGAVLIANNDTVVADLSAAELRGLNLWAAANEVDQQG